MVDRSTQAENALDVLIVDDEPAICGALSALFESEGYRVATCSDAAECLARLRGGGAHVVLVDVQLGGERAAGVELAQRIRGLARETKIVLHTGLDPRGLKLAAGVVDMVIQKGSIFELLKKLKPLLPSGTRDT